MELVEAVVVLVQLDLTMVDLQQIPVVVMVVMELKMHIELDQTSITPVVAVVELTPDMVEILLDRVDKVVVE